MSPNSGKTTVVNTPNLQQFPLDLFETPLRLICDLVPGCSKVTLRKKGFEDLVVARYESTEQLRWQLEANARPGAAAPRR